MNPELDIYKYLSFKQKQICELAKRQGFITFPQILLFYSERKNARNAIERLVALKILKSQTNPHVWAWQMPEIINKDPQTKLAGALENDQ